MRKNIGVSIEGHIRLQRPLVGSDLRSIREDWICLEPLALTRSPVSQGTASQPSSIQAQSGASTPMEEDHADNDDDLEGQFYDASTITSHLVLEHELKDIEERLLGAGIDQQIRAIWQERRENYELKTRLMSVQVESGLLLMQDYAALLATAIQNEKTRALLLKRRQRLDLAKRSVMRIRWMQQEIDELAVMLSS